MKKLLIIIATAIMFIQPTVNTQKKDVKFNQNELEVSLNKFIEERKDATAGVSFAIFENGNLIIRKDIGYTDVQNKVLVDENSVFEWGSVSKLLIWVSALQLYEKGKLDLNEDIEKYLPKNFLSNKKFDKKITFIDLMNHQAGFQETIYPVETTNEEIIKNNTLKKALIYSMPSQIYEPKSVTAYSNWGAALGAYIIENITNQDFASYVHENIFNKIGMKHTALLPDWSDNNWVKETRNKMNSYSYFDTVKEDFGTNISNILLYPSGAATGTASDFYLFTEALIPGNDLNLFNNPKTLEKLYEPTLYYSNVNKVRNSHGFWTLEYSNTVYGHGGNTVGFTSSLWIDIENKKAVAVMSNEQGETAYNYGLHPLVFGISSLETSGEVKDISGIYFSKRTIENGFGRIYKYISGIMPVFKTDDSRIYNLPGNMQIIQIDDFTYMQVSENGLMFPIYLKDNNVLESYTSDYERFSLIELFIAGFLIVGTLICFITYLIRIIYLFIKKSNNKELYLSIGILLLSLSLLFLWLNTETDKTIVIINSIVTTLLGIIPIIKIKYLLKSDNKKLISQWILVFIAIIPFIALIFMQSYIF